ncbi:unnamed protein product [Aphanomyces euteiches]|nr:hypothetical protein AeRB84_000960 [Aphanomyces euteiches]
MPYAAQGIAYFVANPSLWVLTLGPLVTTLIVGLCSTIGISVIGFYPQSLLLEQFGLSPFWAWILALILVVVEIFLTTLIYALVCTPCFVPKIFDRVLEMRGHRAVLDDAPDRANCGHSCGACCRVSVLSRIVIVIVSLPLHFIPVVGTIAYIWMNGSIVGWEAHQYYFDMKGYSYTEQKAIFESHRAKYSSLGIQSMYLELVPFAGFLFIFTNAVGAALFAADLEDEFQKNQRNYGTYSAKQQMLYI